MNLNIQSSKCTYFVIVLAIRLRNMLYTAELQIYGIKICLEFTTELHTAKVK